jgi:hypothetical protein
MTSQVMSSKSAASFIAFDESVSLPPRPANRLPTLLRPNCATIAETALSAAAVLAHVLTVFCLGIKQLAKLRIGFNFALG